MDYIYDGSFEGFLTCIYYHYYKEKASGIYCADSYQNNMLSRFYEVETDEEMAVTVYDGIEKKISNQALKRIYRVFLSNVENKETILLNYIVSGFKIGASIDLLHSNPTVFHVQQVEKKVTFEVHRLTGLVRFSVLQPSKAWSSNLDKAEILYCSIDPDHDVLEFLAEHFSDRFKNDPFIIHDQKRGKALFSYKSSWHVEAFSKSDFLVEAEDERSWRQLWKEYFDTIGIKERINPKCQKRCMPTRYWKNLTEMRI